MKVVPLAIGVSMVSGMVLIVGYQNYVLGSWTVIINIIAFISVLKKDTQ